MKKYIDFGVYDFSDYAEEIIGEDLIKINGGSSSCNGSGSGNGGSSAASGGSGSKGSGSSSIGASSGSCGGSPSVPSGSSGNSSSGFSTSGSGSGSAPSSGTGSCGGSISSGADPNVPNPGTPSGSTQTSSEYHGVPPQYWAALENQKENRDYGELPEANPHAFAYYKALQGQARIEGNTGKYSGYNVLGYQKPIGSDIKTDDVRTFVLVVRQNDGTGNEFDSNRYVYKNGKMVFHDKVGANCSEENKMKSNNNLTEPDGEYYFTTKGLIKNKDGTFDSDSYHNVLIHQTNDSNIPKEIRDKINISPRDFLEHCNQFKTSNSVYSTNHPYSAGCTIGQGGQYHHDIYMKVLLDGVNDVTKIKKVIASISNI